LHFASSSARQPIPPWKSSLSASNSPCSNEKDRGHLGTAATGCFGPPSAAAWPGYGCGGLVLYGHDSRLLTRPRERLFWRSIRAYNRSWAQSSPAKIVY
jgi:hypothetical protein